MHFKLTPLLIKLPLYISNSHLAVNKSVWNSAPSTVLQLPLSKKGGHCTEYKSRIG